MTFKLKHKNKDFPYRSLSVVASNSAKADRNADNEEVNNKETGRINTTPATRPPLFSDSETHRKTTESLNTKKANSKEANKQERIEDEMGL